MKAIQALRMRRAGGAAASWHPATLAPLAANNGAWTNFTLRAILPLSVMPGNGTKIRFAIKPGDSTEGVTITKCYVGLLGGGTENFSATPVQAFFGGNPGFTAAAGGAAVMSDEVVLAYTTADTLVVSAFVPSGISANDTFSMSMAAIGISKTRYKAGDDAATVTTSGYANLVSANNFIATLDGWY